MKKIICHNEIFRNFVRCSACACAVTNTCGCLMWVRRKEVPDRSRTYLALMELIPAGCSVLVLAPAAGSLAAATLAAVAGCNVGASATRMYFWNVSSIRTRNCGRRWRNQYMVYKYIIYNKQ